MVGICSVVLAGGYKPSLVDLAREKTQNLTSSRMPLMVNGRKTASEVWIWELGADDPVRARKTPTITWASSEEQAVMEIQVIECRCDELDGGKQKSMWKDVFDAHKVKAKAAELKVQPKWKKGELSAKIALNRKMAEILQVIKPKNMVLADDLIVYSSRMFGQDDGERIISGLFKLPAKSQDALRKLSGEHGISIRRSSMGPEEPLLKEKAEEAIVPLPNAMKLPEALAIAKSHAKSFGIAFRRNGALMGLRVAKTDEEACWLELCGKAMPGDKIYEIPGLPETVGAEELKAKLKEQVQWDVDVLKLKPRHVGKEKRLMAIVRATTEPSLDVIDIGNKCIVIRPAKGKDAKEAKVPKPTSFAEILTRKEADGKLSYYGLSAARIALATTPSTTAATPTPAEAASEAARKKLRAADASGAADQSDEIKQAVEAALSAARAEAESEKAQALEQQAQVIRDSAKAALNAASVDWQRKAMADKEAAIQL